MKLKPVAFVCPLFLAAICALPARAACTNASLSGPFGYTLTGAAASGGAGNGVGLFSFDGNGNVTGLAQTWVSQGAANTWAIDQSTANGTYSLATNCMGTVTFIDANGPSHFFFVLAPSGFGQSVRTDAVGFTMYSTAIPLGSSTCPDPTVRTFALSLTGHVIGTGPVAYVGRANTNGNGVVSGTIEVDLNGSTLQRVGFTGAYTENANCTGTMSLTPTGHPTMNFQFVAVSGGKQLLMVETDANSIVSGTLTR